MCSRAEIRVSRSFYIALLKSVIRSAVIYYDADYIGTASLMQVL